MLFVWFYQAGVFSHWVVRLGSGLWVGGVSKAVRSRATTRTLHGLWTSRPCRRFAGSCIKLHYLGKLCHLGALYGFDKGLIEKIVPWLRLFLFLCGDDAFFARQWQHIQLFVKHSFLKDWRCGYSKVGLMLWPTIGCYRTPKEDNATEAMTKTPERSQFFFSWHELWRFDTIWSDAWWIMVNYRFLWCWLHREH